MKLLNLEAEKGYLLKSHQFTSNINNRKRQKDLKIKLPILSCIESFLKRKKYIILDYTLLQCLKTFCNL